MSAHGSGYLSAARVGMIGLIVAEASLFAVFVVAYLYDLGKSLSGPSPKEVLSVPVLGTVCLLSSSVTVALAVRAFGRGAVRRCGAWLLATVVLAVVFLTGTGPSGCGSSRAKASRSGRICSGRRFTRWSACTPRT